MLVILALCLLQLLHVDACETSKHGVSWTFDASVDEVIPGVETVQECENECLKKETCAAYTLQEGPLNYCYMFITPSQLIACSECKSGLITKIMAGSSCTFEPDQIIGQAHVNSSGECLDLCAQTDKCTNFLYLTSSPFFNVCFLSNGCDEITDCEDCHSGEMNCFFELPEECTNHMVLDDPSRNNQHSGGQLVCDAYFGGDEYVSPDWQGPGWYRFGGGAGTQLADQPPGHEHCGTVRSGWTEDQHPQNPGEQKSMTVCLSYDFDDGCFDPSEILATNCQDYYVYYMDNFGFCHSRYCGSF